jgi:chromosome segregation ATPase
MSFIVALGVSYGEPFREPDRADVASLKQEIGRLAQKLGSKDSRVIAMRMAFSERELACLHKELNGLREQFTKDGTDIGGDADRAKALRRLIVAVTGECDQRKAELDQYRKNAAKLRKLKEQLEELSR